MEPPRVYAAMVEQPAPVHTFLYPLDGRADQNVPISGVNCTIEVNGYEGSIAMIVSCVTRTAPYRPHPFKLVGKYCRDGVCRIEANVTAENRIVQLQNIGIQRVAMCDINTSLQLRESLRIDPFRIPADVHRDVNPPYGVNDVRLAIQVFGASDDMVRERRRYNVPIYTLVTNVIADRSSRLRICRISQPSGSARGGEERMLVTAKSLPHDTVTVRFEEPATGWHADVVPTRLRPGVLVFRTPPYRVPHTRVPAGVLVCLRRAPPGAGARVGSTSDPIPFEYAPAPAQTQDFGASSATSRKRTALIEAELPSKRRKTIDKTLLLSLMDLNENTPGSSRPVGQVDATWQQSQPEHIGNLLAQPPPVDPRRYMPIEILDAWLRSQYDLVPALIHGPVSRSPSEQPSITGPVLDLDCSLLDLPLDSILGVQSGHSPDCPRVFSPELEQQQRNEQDQEVVIDSDLLVEAAGVPLPEQIVERNIDELSECLKNLSTSDSDKNS